MVSKRRLHFVRFYDRRSLRKDSHRIRCVYFRKQRRRSSEGFSTITLFKKEQPKKPPADALDAVWNRQLGSVQKAFFSTGRVGEGTGLLRLNQIFVLQTKRPSRKSGAAFLWYGRGALFPYDRNFGAFWNVGIAKIQRRIFHSHSFQGRATDEDSPADARDAFRNR